MCTALQQIYISSYLPPNSSLDRNHFVTAQSGDREMRENDVDDNCISGHSTTQQTFPNSNNNNDNISCGGPLLWYNKLATRVHNCNTRAGGGHHTRTRARTNAAHCSVSVSSPPLLHQTLMGWRYLGQTFRRTKAPVLYCYPMLERTGEVHWIAIEKRAQPVLNVFMM